MVLNENVERRDRLFNPGGEVGIYGSFHPVPAVVHVAQWGYWEQSQGPRKKCADKLYVRDDVRRLMLCNEP